MSCNHNCNQGRGCDCGELPNVGVVVLACLLVGLLTGLTGWIAWMAWDIWGP